MQQLVTVPATNDRGPRYMERALAAIHQTCEKDEVLWLRYGSIGGRVGLTIEFDDARRDQISGPILANYPDAALTTIEGIDGPEANWEAWTTDLTLSPDIFPLLRYAQFDDPLRRATADPIATILQSVQPAGDCHCAIEIAITPAPAMWKRRANATVRLLDRTFFRTRHRLAHYYAKRAAYLWHPVVVALTALAKYSPHAVRSTIFTSTSRQHDREEHLQAAAEKLAGHLFASRIRLVAHVPRGCRDRAVERLRQLTGALGAVTKGNLAVFHATGPRRGIAPEGAPFLLSHEELATLFCPPTAGTAVERMQASAIIELEPPPHFTSGEEFGAVTIGRVQFRSDDRLIGLTEADRARHQYVVGATGAGKSTLLLNMIRQDMQAGRGVTLLDVHGDLADAVLALAPKQRTQDVIVFDPASDAVVPFNPLWCSDRSRVGVTTSGVVSAFRKLFDSWGPRLENLLRCSVYAVVEQNGGLLDVLRLLTDRAFRERLVPRIENEVVRSFWATEFRDWALPLRTEAVSSVTNKVMPFLTDRRLRNMVDAATRRSLDLRTVLDQRQILLANVSRGRLGQDNATLLGSLLLTALEQAALSRADVPEHDRIMHHMYLDEFHSLITPSTAIMLSEARKYRVGLVLSHQMTRQLDAATYHAVVGNCGTLVCFRVGLEDAALLAPALSKYPGHVRPEHLTSLPNYAAYARLLIEGVPAQTCSIRTMPPPEGNSERSRAVRITSARRWGARATVPA